jgi:hypothetical protein
MMTKNLRRGAVLIHTYIVGGYLASIVRRWHGKIKKVPHPGIEPGPQE